jgi:hypothetical protein
MSQIRIEIETNPPPYDETMPLSTNMIIGTYKEPELPTYEESVPKVNKNSSYVLLSTIIFLVLIIFFAYLIAK